MTLVNAVRSFPIMFRPVMSPLVHLELDRVGSLVRHAHDVDVVVLHVLHAYDTLAVIGVYIDVVIYVDLIVDISW